jgi:glutathione S-transferase
MYILYHFPYSQHARRVVSLMMEAQLDHQLRHVAMDHGEHHSPEFLRINPNQQVPTLIDGDIRLHESNAILRYLCVKHGLRDWYPDALRARALLEQWLDWNQCRLSPAVVDIVVNEIFSGETGDQTAAKRGRERLSELWPILEDALSRTDFLAGPTPTIADLSLASSVFQLSLANIQPAGTHTRGWMDRISRIEGFRRSLPE